MKSPVVKLTTLYCVLLVIVAALLMAFAPHQTITPPVVATPAVVVAAPPVDETPPPLTVPDYLPILITAGLGWLLTEGLKSLRSALPGVKDFTNEQTAIVGAVTTIIVGVLNYLLTFVPPDLVPLAIALFGILAGPLGAYGISGVVKRFQTKAMQAPPVTITLPSQSRGPASEIPDHK